MRQTPSLVASLAAVALALLATGCASIPKGRAAIDTVKIHGNSEIPSKDITDRLATAETSRLLGLFSGLFYDYSIYDESVLQRDLARVERYYRGQGFLEAHTRAARVSHVAADHVRIDIDVEEGPPTKNRRIDIAGLDDLPAADAQEIRKAARVALPEGDRFDEESYKKAQDAVRRALTDDGYAYARVKAAATADVGANAIDYQFTVDHGIQAVFGPIVFVGPSAEGKASGSSVLKNEALLRRTVDIRPNAKYSEAAIESATQALLDLGVFSSVQIEPQLPDPPSPVVQLVAKVQPASLQALRLGGGFEFDAIKTEIHVSAGWQDRNFLGGLRDLDVQFKPGVVLYPLRIQNIDFTHLDPLPQEFLRASLEQPGFIESRTKGIVQVELNTYPLLVEPNPTAGQPVPGFVEPKGTVGVRRRFGKHVNATLAYNVQGEIPFHYPGTPQNDPLATLILAFPQLITQLDFRDDAIHPHKGIYVSNDLQVAGFPGADIPADVRVQPEIRGYIPIARGITLALRATVGFVYPFAGNYGGEYQQDLAMVRDKKPVAKTQELDDDIETMYFRGFASGGPNSNRGFVLREVGPYGAVPFLSPGTASTTARRCSVPAAPGSNRTVIDPSCTVPIGGFSLWEASAEVRFDLSGPLGVAAFCDSSNVSSNTFDLSFQAIRLSCGAGGRYDTPVGPVRLDVAVRIQPVQVFPFPDESAAFNADATWGQPTRIFGQPFNLAFGIGEAF